MKITKNPVFLHYFSKFMGILLFVLKYMYIFLLLKMINRFSWPAKIMVSLFNLKPKSSYYYLRWHCCILKTCSSGSVILRNRSPKFPINSFGYMWLIWENLSHGENLTFWVHTSWCDFPVCDWLTAGYKLGVHEWDWVHERLSMPKGAASFIH